MTIFPQMRRVFLFCWNPSIVVTLFPLDQQILNPKLLFFRWRCTFFAFLILLGVTYCPHNNSGFYLSWNLLKSVDMWLVVTLVFCFIKKKKFCSIDFDLDHVEHYNYILESMFLLRLWYQIPFYPHLWLYIKVFACL